MPSPSKVSMKTCAKWRAYDAWQSPAGSGTWDSGTPIERSMASGVRSAWASIGSRSSTP